MRILIIGLNYLPESTSIGPYTSDLAEYLIARGHDVHVVTGFPMAPQWRVWDGYDGKVFMRDKVNDVPLLRTYLFVPHNPRKAWKRILFDLSFTISSFIGGLATRPCDVIAAVSPPLQLGLTAWALAKLKRARFFFHLQDLVPDAAVATGMLPEGSVAVRLARMIERFVYRRADGIGVICDGFTRNLRSKGVTSEKIALLPNYIDLNFIRPGERVNGFRTRHGLCKDDFVVVYSGSISQKQGLNTFIDAAGLLRKEPNVAFMLIGEGPYLEDLKYQAARLELSNVRFLPLQPRSELAQQLAAADVLSITQRRAVTDICFPGKLLYYMAAGRPIIASVSPESETGRFIIEHGIGLVTPPEDAFAFAQAVLSLREQGAAELGTRGRAIAERFFDRDIVLPAFADHLERLLR